MLFSAKQLTPVLLLCIGAVTTARAMSGRIPADIMRAQGLHMPGTWSSSSSVDPADDSDDYYAETTTIVPVALSHRGRRSAEGQMHRRAGPAEAVVPPSRPRGPVFDRPPTAPGTFARGAPVPPAPSTFARLPPVPSASGTFLQSPPTRRPPSNLPPAYTETEEEEGEEEIVGEFAPTYDSLHERTPDYVYRLYRGLLCY